jgi:hypothetical protein
LRPSPADLEEPDGTISAASSKGESMGEPDSPPSCPLVSQHDPVELALATALDRASAAGQWTAVEVLARELEARRKSRTGVVQLDAERRKRESGDR